MRRDLPVAILATLCACAATAPAPPDPAVLPTARAVQLARVRCLLVAPFENASDDLRVGDAATAALATSVDRDRTRVYPIEELRALFKGTAQELPDGIPPSLALELGEIVGADAVLYGSVEGRSRGANAELTITFRLAATGARDTLFARAVPVRARPDEEVVDAVRRAVLDAAGPALERLGVPGRKGCFERQRLERVRLVTVASERASAGTPSPAPLPPPPASALPAAAAVSPEIPAGAPRSSGAGLRSQRQSDWAEKLAARERFVLEDVTFFGRTPRFERDTGLADLSAAVMASSVRIRLEGFVDASADPDEDLRVSMMLARTAGRRLVELGVPRDRVTWAGRGRDAPIVPNFTVRGRAANRRIEVVVQ